MGITDPTYEQTDFKRALSNLLPPGEYWKFEKGDELDKLLEAAATEFKTINDETKVSILYAENNTQTGWKIADYQTILNNNNIDGIVFDDSETPNIIYFELQANQKAGDLMKTLDAYKLPHTALGVNYNNEKAVYFSCDRQTLQINRHTMRA